MDAECQFRIPETGEACGKPAEKIWGAGMSWQVQTPEEPGRVGTFHYAYVCQEHFDILSKKQRAQEG